MSLVEPKLSGLVPRELKVRSARIILEGLEVQADIGFHEFEIGAPQRLLVTVETWLKDLSAPADDDRSAVEPRVVPLLDRREERVRVRVQHEHMFAGY